MIKENYKQILMTNFIHREAFYIMGTTKIIYYILIFSHSFFAEMQIQTDTDTKMEMRNIQTDRQTYKRRRRHTETHRQLALRTVRGLWLVLE